MPDCNVIASELQSLKGQKAALQALLDAGNKGVAPGIKKLNTAIAAKQAELDGCVGPDRVKGAFGRAWIRHGAAKGVLGEPTSGEIPAGGGMTYQLFEHGLICLCPGAVEAWSMWGPILAKWRALGGEASPLGWPVADQTATGSGGVKQRFAGGLIVAQPPHPPYFMGTAMADKWESAGVLGAVGYPATDQMPTTDGVGRYMHFETGTMVWHPTLGAFELHGSIRQKYLDLGGTNSVLGYPITDETSTPDGRGRYNHFTGGSIYCDLQGGGGASYEVHGPVHALWASKGFEQGPLGYPTSDEHDLSALEQANLQQPGARECVFQNGRILLFAGGAYSDPTFIGAQFDTAAVGGMKGWAEIRVHIDGSVGFKGHAHNSSIDGFDYRLSAVATGANGAAVAMVHGGHVEGGITGGSGRDDFWDDAPVFVNSFLADRLADFADGTLQIDVIAKGDLTSIAEEAVGWLTRLTLGAAIVGTPALILFAAPLLISQIFTGSPVPGARVIGGALWLAGPSGTVFALIAEYGVALGSTDRPLDDPSEYQLAKRVFGDTLPPLDDIRITDTAAKNSDGSSRAFVFPRFDGKITVNLGTGFADALAYQEGEWQNDPVFGGSRQLVHGETFIHEMVHVWQLHNTVSNRKFMVQAALARLTDLGSSGPYSYDFPFTQEWKNYNIEQQGNIVSHWFGRHSADLTGAAALGDPAFDFVQRHVRIGDA